jgi:hypothetical protein
MVCYQWSPRRARLLPALLAIILNVGWDGGMEVPAFPLFCLLPLVFRGSVFSSRRSPFVFRSSFSPSFSPASYCFLTAGHLFCARFVGAVYSKVAGAPTTPARKLSIVSSLRCGRLALPELPGLCLSDPGKVDVTRKKLKLNPEQREGGARVV